MKLAIVLRAMYVLNTFAVGFKCFEKKKKKEKNPGSKTQQQRLGGALKHRLVWTYTDQSECFKQCLLSEQGVTEMTGRWFTSRNHWNTESVRNKYLLCFLYLKRPLKKKTASISQSSEIFIYNYILIFGVILYCVTSNVPALHIWIPRWNKITCS